jgi:RNA polymerase sigma factor (sigma-70 family)
MSQIASFDALADPELWKHVCLGNESAFEAAVRRYQNLVAAIAYNACGDLVLSEDVAQETFWAAWRERLSLEDTGKLKAWLCGIARNLANHARMRTGKVIASASSGEAIAAVSSQSPDPAEDAVSREEEQLVWQTLEQIPETYREPLILFYREDQSVEEVARSLDLTEEAARQRLSRGRALLRDQVANVVAGALVRSRPSRRFTVAVLAGLGMSAAGTKAALAGTGLAATGAAGVGAVGKAVAGTAATSAGIGVSVGLIGGLLGSLGGLAGGWFGIWLPAQLAPTRAERMLIQRSGARILICSVLFAGTLIAMTFWGIEHLGLLEQILLWFGSIAVFSIYTVVETIVVVMGIHQLRRQQTSESDPNDTPLKTALTRVSRHYRGRIYRSRMMFFGLPLVDINVSDPQIPQPGPSGMPGNVPPRVARGWIAIGDEAHGVLALGGKARGIVAIGGRAFGLISFGGLAFGGLAIGGLAAGIVAVGGAGIGILGLGGLAIGWHAVGGGAIAWDTAVGGLAVAYHWAAGGCAIAADVAFGGMAQAAHANDELAKAALQHHRYLRAINWMNEHYWFTMTLILCMSLLPTLVITPLFYRRESAVPATVAETKLM